MTVRFVPPTGSNGQIIEQPIPLTGPGIAVSAPEYLPLPIAGAWTMQVSATTPTGSITDASATFNVLTADGKVQTPEIAPTPSAPDITPAPTTTVGRGAGHDGLTSSSNGTGAATSSCS